MTHGKGPSSPAGATRIAYPDSWRERWSRLAAAASIGVDEPVVVALSGGADSVFLLHLLCAARERAPLHAVHVHHGLRGATADEDARFCVELCRSLGVDVRVRRLALDPREPSLEARAREARYAALADEARRLHARVLVTAHHADDGLETLLMRWARGSDLAGLAGLQAELRVRHAPALLILRPLISLRRAEIRKLLADAGLAWREDESNRDPRFTRSRVREVFLPKLDLLGGPDALEHLRAFGRAVEDLERELAERTAGLSWSRAPAAAAHRSADAVDLGGVLARASLMALPQALRRRAVWRLIVEGTAHGPSRRVLALILDDLAGGRTARHTLRGGWQLRLAPSRIELDPPAHLLGGAARRQPWLPFAELRGESELPRRRVPAWLAKLSDPPGGFTLPVPGSVTLPDGRRVVAECYAAGAAEPISRDPLSVELDLLSAGNSLCVRWPRAGDRFHPLRAPGSRPLRRVLADAGVPRGERTRVPLVCNSERIVWVAGVRLGDGVGVHATTERRLRLTLLDSRAASRAARDDSRAADATAQRLGRQQELWPPSEPGEPSTQ